MRKLLSSTAAKLTKCFLALALVASIGAASSEDAPQRLAGRAVGSTPMLDDLKELCDQIGGRPTGSSADDRAIEWGAAKFKAAGIDKVSTETFTVPNLWLGESAEGVCIAPERFPIRLVSAPYSPSTPNGQMIEARLVDAG